jgi:hypothetical protein
MSTPVRWYRVPVLWLGIALFGASLAGCIGMIVLASQYPDEPVPVGGERLLKMPTTHDPASS